MYFLNISSDNENIHILMPYWSKVWKYIFLETHPEIVKSIGIKGKQ